MGDKRESDGDLDDSTGPLLIWACPFCDTMGLNQIAGNNSGAQGALRSHIYATDGDGHGPEMAFPDGFDVTCLADYLNTETLDQ